MYTPSVIFLNDVQSTLRLLVIPNKEIRNNILLDKVVLVGNYVDHTI